jgi:hypothetical protein
MAAVLSLEQIIRSECIPSLDCMLTITDEDGEAAFLYFKEGELVEANFASLWGRDALAEILKWRICARAIAPLPLGIKRSLWDPLEQLLNPGAPITASGRVIASPKFKTRHLTNPAAPGALERYKNIPNLLKMVELSRQGETILFQASLEKGVSAEETQWLAEFASRVRAVGETLGFGSCDKWTIETDKNQIVGFAREDKFLALVRRKDAMQDDLESAVAAVTEGL